MSAWTRRKSTRGCLCGTCARSTKGRTRRLTSIDSQRAKAGHVTSRTGAGGSRSAIRDGAFSSARKPNERFPTARRTATALKATSNRFDRILAEARTLLTEEERLRLTLELVPEQGATDPEVDAAWRAEVHRRRLRRRNGETQAQPWEEVEAESTSLVSDEHLRGARVDGGRLARTLLRRIDGHALSPH